MYKITFYSYKGGVGRTLMLANIASIMAKEGYRPFLWDYDLEAPGLQSMPFVKGDVKKGLLDYINDYLNINKNYKFIDPDTGKPTPDYPPPAYPPIEDYLKPIVFDTPSGKMQSWLLAAGNRSNNYYDTLSHLKWKDFYSVRKGEMLINNIIEQIKNLSLKPDYLLVDSRTGFSDVRGICTLHIPQLVVLTFALNEQNFHGIEKIIERIRTSDFLKKRKKHVDYLLAASMVPFEDKDEKYQHLKDFRDKFGELHAIIPYNSAIAYKEKLIVDRYPDSYVSQELKKLYEQIIQKDNNNPDGLVTRAENSFLKGEFVEVTNLLENYVKIPEKARYRLAFLLLAQAYKTMGNLEKYKEYFNIHSNIKPVKPGDMTPELDFLYMNLDVRLLRKLSESIPGNEKEQPMKPDFDFSDNHVRIYKKKFLNHLNKMTPFYVTPGKKIKPKDPDARRPRNINDMTPLTGIIEKHNCFIVGGPGSGKTYSLQWLGIQLIESGRLPVFLSFNRLRVDDLLALYNAWLLQRDSVSREDAFQKSLETAFLNFIAEGMQEFLDFDYNVSTRLVEEQLNKGNFLLLLDGFNEVSSEVRPILTYGMNFLASKSTSLRIAGSSRTEDIAAYDVRFLLVELLPWDEASQREFLEKKFDDIHKAGEFWKKLPKAIRKIARSPIILDMISEEAFVDKKIVKGAIYDNYYRRKISDEFHADSRQVGKMIESLSYISFESLKKGYIVNLPRNHFDETSGFILFKEGKDNQVFDRAEFLAKAEKLGILVILTDQSINFSHQSIQEYFAALWIYNKKGFSQDLVEKALSLAYWDNVFQMLVGFAEDATDVIRNINKLSDIDKGEEKNVGNFSTLVHCLGNAYKVSPGLSADLFWERFLKFLNTQWLMYDYRLELLLNDWFGSLQVQQLSSFAAYLIEDKEERLPGLKTKMRNFLDSKKYPSLDALFEKQSYKILIKKYDESEKLDWSKAVEVLEKFVPPDSDFFGLDRKFLLTSIAHSISLSMKEKIAICQGIPKIDKFKLYELMSIFDEETIKFASLSKEHLNQLADLRENSFHDIVLYEARQHIKEGNYSSAFSEFNRLLKNKYFSIKILKEAFENRDSFNDDEKALLENYAQNYKLLRKSDFPKAISFFIEYHYEKQLQEMLDKNINNLNTFHEIRSAAIAYNKLAQYKSAVKCLLSGLKKLKNLDNNEKRFIYDYLSDNQLELGNRESALEYLTTGIKETDSPLLYLSRGKILVEEKRYREALVDFSRFWETLKENYKAYDDKESQIQLYNMFIPGLTNCLFHLDRINELENYLEFFNKIPDNELLKRTAKIHYNNKAYQESLNTVEKALNLDPLDADLHYWRANNYRFLELFQYEKEAIKSYIDLVKAKIANWENHIGYGNLGFFYFRLRQYQDAGEYLQKALDANPKDLISMANLGHVKLMQGDTEHAFNLYSQVIDEVDEKSKINDYIINDINQLKVEFPDLQRISEILEKVKTLVEQKF